MATTFTTRRSTLQDEIAQAVERGLPGRRGARGRAAVAERFCVYVDHPDGVDHALCARVTHLLDAYLRGLHDRRVLAGPERPLRKPRALRARRRPAGVACAPIARDGRSRFRARSSRPSDGAVHARRRPTSRCAIPYDEIVRGNLIDEG